MIVRAAWIPLDNTSTGRPFTVSPFRLFHDSKNPTTTMSHFQARWTYARLNAAWAGVEETAHPQRGKAFRVTNSCRCQRSEVRRGPANVGPGRKVEDWKNLAWLLMSHGFAATALCLSAATAFPTVVVGVRVHPFRGPTIQYSGYLGFGEFLPPPESQRGNYSCKVLRARSSSSLMADAVTAKRGSATSPLTLTHRLAVPGRWQPPSALIFGGGGP